MEETRDLDPLQIQVMEEVKHEPFSDPLVINEAAHLCLHLPEEEVMLLHLEESKEGIRLVGNPVATPVEEIQEMSSRSSQVTQKQERSGQVWLGCCLCREVFPSREMLQCHVTAIHQRPKIVPVPCQIPVALALSQNEMNSSQGLVATTEIFAEAADINLKGITVRDGPTFWPLPVNGKFMGINQVLNILKQADEILESIPLGEKSNVFFVIKKKWHAGKLSCRDDCGDWSSKDARSVDSYFLIDREGNLKNVFLKNNRYVTHTRKMKKSIWVPLDPQPAEGSVLKIHRFYATLKAKDDYIKRLTSIVSGNVDYSDRMLVEYCGEYVKLPSDDQGSSKRIRKNNQSVLGCEASKPCQVCLDMTENVGAKSSIHSRHRQEEATKNGKSTKQKQDQKLHVSNLVDYIPEKRASSRKRMLIQSANEADASQADNNLDEKSTTLRQLIHQKLHDSMDQKDLGFRYYFIEEISEVLEMLINCVDVQEIIDRKDQPPCVILYSKEQMCDMTSELESGDVIGINKTINFGACHVTVVVYKSSKVVHRPSGKSPLLLGPIYLHWDSEFATYFSFFSHLKSVLGTAALNFELRLMNGHDEAMLKALTRCFPKAECTLCPKHLRDCMREYLCDVVKCEPEDENVIVNKIFGHAGVVMSKDLSLFDKRVSNLQVYFDRFPTFKTYFDNLKPFLTQYLWEPIKKGTSTNLWTNNNREPLNLIMRLSTNWRSQRLAPLIRKICNVSKKQLSDMKRSLYDPGNYFLLERYRSFAVNKNVWLEITQEEQDAIFMKFLEKDVPAEGN